MNRHKFLHFLLLGIILFIAILRVVFYKEHVLPKNQNMILEATIKREPRIFDTTQLIYVGDLKVYTDLYPRYMVGDRVKIKGFADVGGRIYRANIEKTGEARSFSSLTSRLRAHISANIFEILPDREATLLVGTVLGLDAISARFRDELIKTGTIHVVVVSGQNLMIVAGIFMALSKYIGKKQSLILAQFAVFMYAILTGLEAPVLRAAIMVSFASFAIFFGRQVSTALSLFAAAAIIVILFPHAPFEVSFQLTFLATIGITTLGKVLEKKFARLPFLGQNAAISVSAYIFTAPILAYYFGKVSLVAPIVNILVAEAVFPIMILGFLVSILSLVFMPLAQVFAWFAYVPALYFSKVVEIFSNVS